MNLPRLPDKPLITKRDVHRFLMAKITALKILLDTKMRVESTKQLRLEDDLTIKKCLNVLLSPQSSIPQRYACRILIDSIDPDWQKRLPPDAFLFYIDRRDPAVFEWKRAVIKRDRACVACGRNSKLHAHHILYWSEYPPGRLDVENGCTLCASCHSQAHREDIKKWSSRRYDKKEKKEESIER